MEHFWIAVRPHPDLPHLGSAGLHAPAPLLPPSHPPHHQPCESAAAPHWSQVSFRLSAGSANVNSLAHGPSGHGGKISYLRSQVLSLGLNFLGIQEARTPEFCSCVDNLLRMSSGSEGHHHGVELWINLAQPYAYCDQQPLRFTRDDFQVVYRDPRILLVCAETAYWRGWLLVAYAPHSGLPLAHREAWWFTLSEVAARRSAGDPLIVMIDANHHFCAARAH